MYVCGLCVFMWLCVNVCASVCMCAPMYVFMWLCVNVCACGRMRVPLTYVYAYVRMYVPPCASV